MMGLTLQQGMQATGGYKGTDMDDDLQEQI